jgi:periplasmic divalent cation tolerance protein
MLALQHPDACAGAMLVAWTTVPNKIIAETLASSAIAERLAACVQIEGPILSYYTWEGVMEKTEEYRLTFKLLPEQLPPLETWVHGHHPYQTPEWIVVKATHVAEKYLSWAQARPNS